MSSFYDLFLRFRDFFTGGTNELELLIQKVNKMAVDLTELIREVDRVSEVQGKAVEEISTLVSEVKNITEQLSIKTQEAENSVDIQVINDLVNKLKTSTDSLSGVISNRTPAPAPEQVQGDV